MRKIISSIFVIAMLFAILALSYTNTLSDVFNSFSSVYAATETESSSTKAASSSTNTKEESTSGADMTYLLARVLNGEARGEPYLGQVAVAAVIMNRVKSSEFPNSISGVIYQKGQFSCVTDGQINKAIPDGSTVYKAAREAINGSDPSNGALFFYNAKTAKSEWLYTRPTVKVIGNHTFAK